MSVGDCSDSQTNNAKGTERGNMLKTNFQGGERVIIPVGKRIPKTK